MPYGKLALLARGLANVERYDDGRLTLTALTRRGLRGLGRRGELLRGRRRPSARGRRGPRWRRSSATGSATARPGLRKVSLRSGDDRVDVSAIARAQGGGGHRQAAGFTTALSHDELVEFLRDAARRAALTRSRDRLRPDAAATTARVDYVLLYDKPAGVTSHDVVARSRRTLPRKTKVGHAGTLDPFATGLLLVLVGRATRVQRFLMALPKRYEAIARFGAVSSTGDPDGEITEHRPGAPPGDLALPVGVIRQRPPAYSAVKVDGRRAYELARAGESVELAEREVDRAPLRAVLARGRPARRS